MRRLIVVFLFSLASCKARIDDAMLPGNYVYNVDNDDRIELLANNRYLHIIYTDYGKEIIGGTWSYNGSEVTLYNFSLEGGRIKGDWVSKVALINDHVTLSYSTGGISFIKQH